MLAMETELELRDNYLVEGSLRSRSYIKSEIPVAKIILGALTSHSTKA